MHVHSTPQSSNSAAKDWSLVTRRKIPPPVDVMMFMLPGIEQDEAQSFRLWAKEAGLVHYIRGDGKRALQEQDFSKPVPGGLRKNAHIFFNGHGSKPDAVLDQENEAPHEILINQETNASVSSKRLMEFGRRIPQATTDTDAPDDCITLHMDTCHSAELKKEVTPETVLWARGMYLLYGSKKSTDSKDTLPFMKTSLQYLGQCKKNPGSYRPLGLFEALARRRSDCIAMGGGNLPKLIAAHRPRILRDISSPLFSAEPATNPDNPVQDKRLVIPEKILQQLRQIESERLAKPNESTLPADEQIVRLLINCTLNSDLATFTEILTQRPDLVDTLDSRGNSLLTWSICSDNTGFLACLLPRTTLLDLAGQDGCTPLHYAAESDDVASIALLLAGNQQGLRASLNLQDDSGNTPLLSALENDSMNAAQSLIEAGADIHIANHAGQTVLMMAAERGAVTLIRKFMPQRPDIEAKDQFGETAIDKAMAKGHVELAETLFKLAENWKAAAMLRARRLNQTQPAAGDH